ncbi:MAG: hypothetical protein GKS06_15215 [Acidobacteria bacterium]|nr:hypothetical protein [Acidobacteriota bacterium]
MADNKLLGCWGFIMGSIVAVIVGWMTFELLIGILAGLRTDGFAALVDPLLLHEAGELLIIGYACLAIYVWVFRGPSIEGFANTTRPVFWTGAALNAASLVGMWGSRWSTWTLVLIALGFLIPMVLPKMAPEPLPPEPPG